MSRSIFQRRRYLFFAASAWSAASATARYESYEFRELGAADFRRGGVFCEKGRARRFEDRIVEGHRCYGFVAAGSTAAYFWCTTGATAPLAFDLALAVQPEAAYVWDCRTEQGHARRGLYREGLLRMRELAPAGGVWISCERGNVASRKGISRAGFAERFELDLVRAWRWRRIERIEGSKAWRRPGATLSLGGLADGVVA